MERIGVAGAEPQPCARVSLLAVREHDRCAPALDRREAAGPPLNREAEDVHVVGEARVEVRDAEDRRYAADVDSLRCGDSVGLFRHWACPPIGSRV